MSAVCSDTRCVSNCKPIKIILSRLFANKCDSKGWKRKKYYPFEFPLSFGETKKRSLALRHWIIILGSHWVCAFSQLHSDSDVQKFFKLMWIRVLHSNDEFTERAKKKTTHRLQFMNWTQCGSQLVVRERWICSSTKQRREGKNELHANAFHLPHCANTPSRHQPTAFHCEHNCETKNTIRTSTLRICIYT